MRSLVLLCFLVAVAFAAPLKLADIEAKDVPIRAKVVSEQEQTSSIKALTKAKLARLFKDNVQAGETECKICIDFMDEALQNLIEIIANGGIIGGCADLCSKALANKSEILEGVCNILCDIAGIDLFEKILSDVDPDPVWLCEEVRVCDYNDNDVANITSLSVQPASGKTGTKFTFDIEYDLITFSGIGSIGIVVFGPGAVADGGALLYYPAEGEYSGSFSLSTKPDSYNVWSPGSYEMQVAVCEGDCGCTHDHNKVLTLASVNFTITNGAPRRPHLLKKL